MASTSSTCWILVEGAAAGHERDREDFARRYGPVVRAYLGARWRGTAWIGELDDAVQEVFVDCFRDNGLLERAERGRPGGFRAFLYGAARLVALRFERREARRRGRHELTERDLDAIERDGPTLSRAFDRAWARSLLREARHVQRLRATAAGADAIRRVELLRLRFHEGLAIREIAHLWETDPAPLHKEYARARGEFKAALLEVVAFHYSLLPRDLERRCAEVLELAGG